MVNNRAWARATRQSTGDFHHPYNFVTAFPRHHDKLNNSDLGDAQKLKEIASHGKYHRDRWTGTIGVTLTTQTPLLIPDAATARDDEGHKYYDIRRTPDGKPYLPLTEIKGMLRTAYEIVTNSRYSVFVEHQDRLAYRINAQGVDLIPARVERKGDKLYLRLMEGKDIEIAGRTPNLLGYAAKLPRYQRGVERSNKRKPEHKKEDPALFPLEYPDGILPQHGDRVWVRFNEFGEDTIRKSVITRIRPYESDSPPPGDGTWHKGWVFVSNENILGKKYERVFIEQEQITPNNGHFKKWYRRGDGINNKDNQNRSIKAWVKPNTTFKFNIDVTNLSDVELGALLWLLNLPPQHYHRLGGGKPFGFGSVRLEIDWNKIECKVVIKILSTYFEVTNK